MVSGRYCLHCFGTLDAVLGGKRTFYYSTKLSNYDSQVAGYQGKRTANFIGLNQLCELLVQDQERKLGMIDLIWESYFGQR